MRLQVLVLKNLRIPGRVSVEPEEEIQEVSYGTQDSSKSPQGQGAL